MLQSNEQWVDIPGYEGLYEISTLGRIHSKKTNKMLHPDKHLSVGLFKQGKQTGWQVNVLMGCAFLGNDINNVYRHRVLYKDGDSSNLHVDNLYVEDTSDLKGEEWKMIESAAGRLVQPIYMISNMGRVKSIQRTKEWLNYGKMSLKYIPEKILSTVADSDGYKDIWLAAADGTEINAQVHRLVAHAFCLNDDPEHKIHVNHIDGNPSNNNAYNLEWVSRSENVNHAIRTGLKKVFNKHMRYPVKRLETGEIFNSIADVDRAMGRRVGYTNERLSHNSVCKDTQGNIWTLEVMKDQYVYVPSEGLHCYFEEYPDRKYISLGEASRDIGRWDGYVSECIKGGRKIISKITGEELHVVYDKEIAAKFNFNK